MHVSFSGWSVDVCAHCVEATNSPGVGSRLKNPLVQLFMHIEGYSMDSQPNPSIRLYFGFVLSVHSRMHA